MATTDPLKQKKKQQILKSLGNAYLPKIAMIAGAVTLAYALLVVGIAALNSWKFEKLGQFGDSFGALTALFNALAFAGLIVTVILQSRELSLTRREMKKQAKSQADWAAAASRQIELTKELESIRSRPVIKAEWRTTEKAGRYEFVMRNVGMGVAVVTGIELEDFAGNRTLILEHGTKEASTAWETCIRAALGHEAALKSWHLYQFNDQNRALAPNEPQALVRLAVNTDNPIGTYSDLRNKTRLTIHFKSFFGERLNTTTQFEEDE